MNRSVLVRQHAYLPTLFPAGAGMNRRSSSDRMVCILPRRRMTELPKERIYWLRCSPQARG